MSLWELLWLTPNKAQREALQYLRDFPDPEAAAVIRYYAGKASRAEFLEAENKRMAAVIESLWRRVKHAERRAADKSAGGAS